MAATRTAALVSALACLAAPSAGIAMKGTGSG